MPIYQYRCKNCGNEVEILQNSTKLQSPECKKCGCKMANIISPVGIIFKGGGFHVTDYGRGNKNSVASVKKSEKESSPAKEKTETKTEAKTDTKTESKSEAKTETKAENTGTNK